MVLKTKLFGKVYEFQSLREVMAKANEESQAMRWLALPLPATRSGWRQRLCLPG